ncbi:MAG: hypothetical protein K5858_11425 [Lachnospiraceae bacterium]|nr:hypothetical protein [Lachnospiraceae bacterium]
MKKVILVIDIILMLITIVVFLCIEMKPTYGLASLSAIAKGILCLFALGVEVLILVILYIVKEIQNRKDIKGSNRQK